MRSAKFKRRRSSWRAERSPSTINLRLAAIRRLAYEASDCGLLSPDPCSAVGEGRGRQLDCQCRHHRWSVATVNQQSRQNLGPRLYSKGDLRIVKVNAKYFGLPSVAPHDLRRSCARLCHQAGGERDQIQFLLGHVSIQTTKRYLGCKQRFRDAVNDHIGVEPDAPS